MANDPRPQSKDILDGWHIVRAGKVKSGDRFWRYGRGSWEPVVDRTTFLDSEAANLMTTIIRRDELRKSTEEES
jgi:hypothetical protein